MNILFYYPGKERSIAFSSLMIAFQQQGHNVFLLTHMPEGDLHHDVKKYGVQTFTHQIKKHISSLFYLKHILFLISFTNKNKIDIVYSHTQQANIISVFAQFFSLSRFIICRHHAKRTGGYKNFNQDVFDIIINKLGKSFIVPSKKVYEQIIAEKVNPAKVKLIYYGYDFSKYTEPDINEVKIIKSKYSTQLLLASVSRLVPGKRYEILFETIHELIIDHNLDIKLMVVGDGDQMKKLEQFVTHNKLEKYIYLVGYKLNVIDYMAASDAVVLLSESEASNNVIKEAGLLKKCVLVCNDVGDFNDYIINNFSGLFLDREKPKDDLKKYLLMLYENKINKSMLGENLYKSVLDTFSIEQVISKYDEINQK